jgi:hypothetical protein
MSQMVSKITVVLLLPVFLMVTTGVAFSNAWCLGSDGHVEIEALIINGCSDGDVENRNVVRQVVPSFHLPNDGHSRSCLDFSVHVQLSETASLKRLEKSCSVSIGALTHNSFPPISTQNVKLVVGNLAPQPPPRIPPTILIHRTVVLLV